MGMPTAVVVGAAKSGTTALYKYLGQHPDVFVTPIEEPSFFAFEGEPPRFRGPNGTAAAVNATAVTDLAVYQGLFRHARPDQARLDISPAYLYWPSTPRRIAEHVPSVRICAILRHPVDRAYSAFMHARREGREPITRFEDALAAEPQRIADNWGLLWRYRDLGRYAEQLGRYISTFGRDRLKIVLYDDLVADPGMLCQELEEFIGVDPSFVPDTALRHNVSGVPVSRFAYRMLRRGSPVGALARAVAPIVGRGRLQRQQVRLRNRLLRTESLDPAVRSRLTEHWRHEVEELSTMIGRDLGHWLS